jgi:hypothetical protein
LKFQEGLGKSKHLLLTLSPCLRARANTIAGVPVRSVSLRVDI